MESISPVLSQCPSAVALVAPPPLCLLFETRARYVQKGSLPNIHVIQDPMAFQSMPTSGKPCPETERTVSRNRFPEGKNQSLVKSPGQRNPMQYSKALSTVKRTKLLIYYMVTFGGGEILQPRWVKSQSLDREQSSGIIQHRQLWCRERSFQKYHLISCIISCCF